MSEAKGGERPTYGDHEQGVILKHYFDLGYAAALKDAAKADKLEAVVRENVEWSNQTFGVRPATAPLAHLRKEVGELFSEPGSLFEYADCALLLFQAAVISGFSVDNVVTAMRVKLEINKGRKWGPPDEHGACQHE